MCIHSGISLKLLNETNDSQINKIIKTITV